MGGRSLRPATLAVHAGQEPDPVTGAVVPPLVLTTIYRHDRSGPLSYGRDRNATWERLEEALAALESGLGAAVFPSGMAAIDAVIGLVPVGARVVASDCGYSGTRSLLARLHGIRRVDTVLVDIADAGVVDAACDGAALLCLESLTNPMLTVPDIAACAGAAHRRGALVMVDNTFATPLTLQPLRLGADLVVHSLTKYAGGHSDLLLGGAVWRDPELGSRLHEHRVAAGAVPGQLEAWLALRGLRTLEVRVTRQMANAIELASRLTRHPAAVRVHHPSLPDHPQHERAVAQMHGGFGAVVSVEVRGGAEAAEAVCAATRLWTPATSLGGVESTLERRARYPAESPAVPPGLIRLSVGIEDVDDLWHDLDAALRSAAS